MDRLSRTRRDEGFTPCGTQRKRCQECHDMKGVGLLSVESFFFLNARLDFEQAEFQVTVEQASKSGQIIKSAGGETECKGKTD